MEKKKKELERRQLEEKSEIEMEELEQDKDIMRKGISIEESCIAGLEKLGFYVHESRCFSNQVQKNVVHLVILCSLSLYKVRVFASSCTLPCTK